MFYWNVLISVNEHDRNKAILLLQKLGSIYRSEKNVLLLNVSNIFQFLVTLNTLVSNDPSLSELFTLVVPVTATFSFQSLEEFKIKTKALILCWLPKLVEKSFNFTMHCRGFEDLISSQAEKHYLSQFLIEELEKIGSFGHVNLENPDITIAIETIDSQAGLSYWTREELQRYPILKLNS